MLQVDPVKSYLNFKIGLTPVLKAGSSVKNLALIAQKQLFLKLRVGDLYKENFIIKFLRLLTTFRTI